MANIRTVGVAGDHISFGVAVAWMQANHNYDTDGMATIQELDGALYTENISIGGISGTPTISAHLEIIPAIAVQSRGKSAIDKTRIRNAGGGNQALLLADDYVHIHGIEFILDSTSSSHECIRFSGSSNILIDHCLLRSTSKRSSQDGIYTSSSSSVAINNCAFYGFGRAAIHIQNSSGSHTIDINGCTGIDSGYSSGGGGTGFVSVRNNSGGTVNINVTNCAGFVVTTSGESYEQYGNNVGGITWSGSNNIASDTSAEAKFTNSYDEVSVDEAEPASGESFWITDLTSGAEDLEIAGENSFTVSQNGISPVSADSRADYTIDIVLATRKATRTIGAFEFVASGTLITPAAGSFSIAGQDATVISPSVITPGAGSFSIAGQDIIVATGFIIIPGVGSFSIAGQDIIVATGFIIIPGVGSFSIAGQDIIVDELRVISPATATISIIGQIVDVDAVFVQIKRNGIIYKIVGPLIDDLIKELL